jgi:hypothetical protein
MKKENQSRRHENTKERGRRFGFFVLPSRIRVFVVFFACDAFPARTIHGFLALSLRSGTFMPAGANRPPIFNPSPSGW